MKFGMAVLLKHPFNDRESCLEVAQKSDAFGMDYLAVNDRVIMPSDIKQINPYTSDGKVGTHWLKKDGAVLPESLEAVAAMGFMAGCTSRITLLTSVLILAHRPPILAAKMLTTLDILSQGRFIAGVAAGWLEDEFLVLGSDAYHHRGALLDEYLEAFERLWSDNRPEYDGKYVKVHDIIFAPKPVNRRVPMWIAGEAPSAMRRAARFGDGWLVVSTNKQRPLDTAERFAAAVKDLHRACDTIGRDPSTLSISLLPANWTNWDRASSGDPLPFFGETDKVIEDIVAYQKAGLTHLTLQLQTLDRNESIERLQWYAEEVKPHVPL